MQRWTTKVLFLLLSMFMLASTGGVTYARDILLLGSDNETVRLPHFVHGISPKLAEKAVGEVDVDYPEYLKEFWTVDKKYEINYSSCVLEELKKAIEVLPEAARDLHGKKVGAEGINGKTIIVNSKVTQVLKENNILPGPSPRDTAMLFQLLDVATEYKIPSLANAYAFEIAKRIKNSTFDGQAKLKKDKYYKHQGDGTIYHQAVEQALITLQDSLSKYQEEFPNMDCTKNKQHIERYVAMLLAGIKKEFTFADFIGLKGQDSWRDGKVKLAGAGLTSLDGLQLVDHPNKITEIDVSSNDIQTPQNMKTRTTRGKESITVDSSGQSLIFAFSRLTNLHKLDLSNNKIDRLPGKVFNKNPLKTLKLDNNRLKDIPEDLCKGLKRQKIQSFSIKNNQMPGEEIKAILRILPGNVVTHDHIKED